MATFRRRGNRWRAEVRMRGVYRSRTFHTKADAKRWAAQTEAQLEDGASGPARTVKEALHRYGREISIRKKGRRWEDVRLRLLERYDFAYIDCRRISAEDVAKWRDIRLREVSAASVNRELNLLSAVFEAARREWRWMLSNPVRDVRRPPRAQPRDRRISEGEIERVLLALGFDEAIPVRTTQQRIAVAFLFALETAMRLGEICSLRWEDVHGRYLTLHDTKNDNRRDVPLSLRAVDLLGKLDGECPFPMRSEVASTLFRRAVQNAEIQNLRFHDSRHEAISRLARKLDVLDLARMVGHRDPRSLMVYYNATAEEIAKRLD